MNSANLTASNAACFFELSGNGRVLYSRFRRRNSSISENADLVGHNFFDEIADFENVREFRHKFNSFVESREFTDNFVFECLYPKEKVPVRVLMLRTLQNGDCDRESSVIVDIRNNAY